MSTLDCAVSRRKFFEMSGTGLFLCFTAEAQEPSRLPGRQGYPTDFNAYLKVGGDGRVTCFVGKVELGQGSKTALAQLLAEELDVDVERVDMVMGDTDVCPWDMGTFGSLSIRQFGPVLKAAAAEARAVLLQLAAERLKADPAKLTVQSGVVSAGQEKVSYAQLVEGRRIERHVSGAAVKPVREYRVVGKSPQRKDAVEKVTGKAKYAADQGLPGTLHARILRPPAHGVVLEQADTSAAEKMPGVRVVRDGDLIAVLAERPDTAEEALEKVKASFRKAPAGPDDRTIFDHVVKKAAPAQQVHQSGDLAGAEKSAAQVVERTWLNSYVAHAPMEPHAAVAAMEGDKLTVWAGTQAPFTLKQQIAQAAGLAQDKVRVVTPYVGGGFGGKSASRQAVEAARLAKLTGKPVQVAWDRAEEFFYDTFRPAAVVKIRTGISGQGRMVSWDYLSYCAGDREARQFYDIPNQRTLSSGNWSGAQPEGLHPFAVGPWRAPSVNTHTFARESQIDVIASQLGRDPLEFRLAHLTETRIRRVLERTAAQFGWKASKAPSGRGVGVACALYLGSFVAAMAEVEVNRKTGAVHVKRVVLAEDHGVTVSPDGSRQQIEGSVMMGLGYTLSEEVHFRDGAVLDKSFSTYHLPRFSWLPRIEPVLIENPDSPASGCGEPPIVVVGAVVANAVFDAVGARVPQLPMTPERVLKAMA
jgi:isoquinoline 1-oxidoreductase